MKKKLLFIASLVLTLLVVSLLLILLFKPKNTVEERFVQHVRKEDEIAESKIAGVNVRQPGDYILLENPNHVYQTFNNCGPATLSMMLSYYGINVSQSDLADQMRPYQVSSGDNDDKNIFSEEFTETANKYGLKGISRVNGDIALLQKLTSNGFPVVVKTFLHKNDDIGHFRMVRGYDDSQGVIIQDDSYEGKNKKFSYYDFLSLWQPFNYNYIVIYKEDQEKLLSAVLGEEWDSEVAWQNANQRASQEVELDSKNVYPWFNLSTSYYHLGEYQQSTEAFERVEDSLPKRMLWYQIEPLQAYMELGEYDKVFQLANNILENGNRAFSELYYLKGEIYLEQGNQEVAKHQLELALQYNENYQQARDKLDELN